MKRDISVIVSGCAVLSCLAGCVCQTERSQFDDPENRVYCKTDIREPKADVFFVGPMAYRGTNDSLQTKRGA